jgi:hypothetical protein
MQFIYCDICFALHVVNTFPRYKSTGVMSKNVGVANSMQDFKSLMYIKNRSLRYTISYGSFTR